MVKPTHPSREGYAVKMLLCLDELGMFIKSELSTTCLTKPTLTTRTTGSCCELPPLVTPPFHPSFRIV